MLVSLRAPHLMEDLFLDPEGGGLAVKSTNRDALPKLAELVAAAKRDPRLLDAALERARTDGKLE